MQRDLPTSLLFGSVSGGLGFAATLPLDFVKQWLQSGHQMQHIVQAVKEKGVPVLWRGFGIGSSIIVPQVAIKFGAYSWLSGHIGPGFHSAFLAGYIDGSFLGPPLAIQGVQQMLHNVTLREAYRGIRPKILNCTHALALRNAFYTGPVLGYLGPLRSALFDKTRSPLAHATQTWICAFILNIPAVYMCSPFDVVRAWQVRLLAEGEINKSGFRQVARSIMIQKGFRGFFTGHAGLWFTFASRFPLTIAINDFLWTYTERNHYQNRMDKKLKVGIQ